MNRNCWNKITRVYDDLSLVLAGEDQGAAYHLLA